MSLILLSLSPASQLSHFISKSTSYALHSHLLLRNLVCHHNCGTTGGTNGTCPSRTGYPNRIQFLTRRRYVCLSQLFKKAHLPTRHSLLTLLRRTYVRWFVDILTIICPYYVRGTTCGPTTRPTSAFSRSEYILCSSSLVPKLEEKAVLAFSQSRPIISETNQ